MQKTRVFSCSLIYLNIFPGSIAVSQINQRFSPDQIALLESQAVAGITYPNFTSSIRTNFTCANLPRPAWYEELQTSCQQYYYCDETGTLTTFLCPATNVFSQATLRCEAWYNAVCGSRPVVDVSNALSLVSGATTFPLKKIKENLSQIFIETNIAFEKLISLLASVCNFASLSSTRKFLLISHASNLTGSTWYYVHVSHFNINYNVCFLQAIL